MRKGINEGLKGARSVTNGRGKGSGGREGGKIARQKEGRSSSKKDESKRRASGEFLGLDLKIDSRT